MENTAGPTIVTPFLSVVSTALTNSTAVNAAFVTVAFANTDQNNALGFLQKSGNTIQALIAGWYNIKTNLRMHAGGANRGGELRALLNGATDIVNSHAYVNTANGITQATSGIIDYDFFLNANDTVEIQIASTAAQIVTAAVPSKFSLQFLSF